MITSSSNPRIKQVIQWQTQAKERRKDKVFLVEGFKMYEEAPVESVLEDNAAVLELARKHNVNYVLIDDTYKISIDL